MAGTSRRGFLLGSLAGAWLSSRARASADDAEGAAVTFSFGTYGMKAVPAEKAIGAIADVGYDGVELAVIPEWDANPAKLTTERRGRLRDLLSQRELKLTALMEHLSPSRDDAEHRTALARLRQAAELGHDLSPQSPPLIQTVLGGGSWDELKEMYRDRLGGWLKALEPTKTVLAIKPHRGGAMSRPEEAIWLIEQLGRPQRLRMVYDYSHYAYREMPLERTVETAHRWMAHVAIKDAVEQEGKVAFQLPGASGRFDYGQLFALLGKTGYRGDICCEVSGMVSNRPGYDPLAAVKTCYRNIAPVFERAGLTRVRRQS